MDAESFAQDNVEKAGCIIGLWLMESNRQSPHEACIAMIPEMSSLTHSEHYRGAGINITCLRLLSGNA